MTHRLRFDWKQALQATIPFGLGFAKPRHYRGLIKAVWKNRRDLRHAWHLVTRAVCDDCALGAAGLHDWTVPAPHLCLKRLEQLHRHTMPILDPKRLADLSPLIGFSNAQLAALGRLPCPMRRGPGDKGFYPVTWQAALGRVAQRLRQSDPNRIGFILGSEGVTGESHYLAQKVARYLGTNHVDQAIRELEAPNAALTNRALGVTEATCSFSDWIGTGAIVFFGVNPASANPFTIEYLQAARQRGTKVVMVHPSLEPGMSRAWQPGNLRSALFGSAMADYWFPVAPGGEAAFLYGVLKVLLRRGWQDQEWIDRHTKGFGALQRQAESLDWATLEKESGLTWRSLEQFAELISDAPNAVLVWETDLANQSYGKEAVSMILNLGLARGYVGRDQTGLMPMNLRKGSWAATRLGVGPWTFPARKPVTSDNARVLQNHYGFPVPDKPGWSAAEMIQASLRGDLDILYFVGGDPSSALPDPAESFRALAQVPLRVHQDLVLTDQMLIDPRDEVLLLPAKTQYEQEGGGIFFTSERRILFSPEMPRPAHQIGEAKAHWRILCELAAAVFPDRALAWQRVSGQSIRQEIAWIVPEFAGVQYLDKCGDALQCGGPHLCAAGAFPTTDGKAHFQTVPLPSLDEVPQTPLPAVVAGPAPAQVEGEPVKVPSIPPEHVSSEIQAQEKVAPENL